MFYYGLECSLSIFMACVGCFTDKNIKLFSLTNIHIFKANYLQWFLSSAHQSTSSSLVNKLLQGEGYEKVSLQF